MTQIAKIMDLPAPGIAVVRVARKTACGHDCENCGGCGAQGGSLDVTASCAVPVEPGDLVEVGSGNRVLAFAALVYLLPLALFLLGYLIPSGLSEPLRCACGGAGFVLGMICAVICDRWVRQRNAVTYQVLRRL